MSFYPPKISEMFLDPKNAGPVRDPSSQGKEVSFVCGSFIEVSLSIGEDKLIEGASYRTNGCGYLIAAAESLTRKLKGETLTELHGFSGEEVEITLASDLETFAAERTHCSKLVADAVRKALSQYRLSLMEEFRGEQPLVCTCFGVTEDTLRRIILETGPSDTADLARHSNAGTGCGSCRMLIQEMIDGLRVMAD